MCACDMCIERKREMNAAEFESGSISRNVHVKHKSSALNTCAATEASREHMGYKDEKYYRKREGSSKAFKKKLCKFRN